MLATVMSLLVGLAGQVPGHGATIVQLACFNDRTVVGVTSVHRVVMSDGGAWRASSIDGDRLWHSPDDRMFVVGSGPFVAALAHGSSSLTRWNLPAALAFPRLAFLDSVVAVTADRIFRLDPGGKLVSIGNTPVAPDRIARVPVLFGARGRLIACYQTSHLEADAAKGACVAPPPDNYEYLVDFGDFRAMAERKFAAPFACGEAIVSVHRSVTQARDLVTGRQQGKISGGALDGSGCIAADRAVLVGENDVRIVDVPALHTVWRKSLLGPVGAATICGNRVAFVRERQSNIEFVDLPAASDGPSR
jgi:hypothetical protein